MVLNRKFIKFDMDFVLMQIIKLYLFNIIYNFSSKFKHYKIFKETYNHNAIIITFQKIKQCRHIFLLSTIIKVIIIKQIK